MKDIDLNDYNYELPLERIAQYPVNERDSSQILIYKGGKITKDIFRNIVNYLPTDALLVFNNTRVIRARVLFQKDTGANIEVLCLEPTDPFEYELSFSSKNPVVWKCIIGNLKKWKSGKIITPFNYKSQLYKLTAEKIQPDGEAWRILFSWNCEALSFGEVIELSGHIPLPPYINRDDEEGDTDRYQTVYSTVKGSVAAPTAGLHFTERVFKKLEEKGIKTVEVTLHVGAGTFQPVKSEKISDHVMHREHFFVAAKTIEMIHDNPSNIIPVGTTSVRTLESLYWLGVKIIDDLPYCKSDLTIGQWEPYLIETSISVKESMKALLNFLKEGNISYLYGSTSIIIIPGYNFRLISGMITNFHQPRSTLLLLVSAWIGKNWKKMYKFALKKDFRFLSYGDCSLIFR
jgi:S-adenosylmethionine:tRNA ribosyltransferase-isomerase